MCLLKTYLNKPYTYISISTDSFTIKGIFMPKTSSELFLLYKFDHRISQKRMV